MLQKAEAAVGLPMSGEGGWGAAVEGPGGGWLLNTGRFPRGGAWPDSAPA